MMINLSDMGKLKRVTAKLASMRKYQEFLPQPNDDGTILVQSDKAIGRFDPKTGKGILNLKGCYFIHLHPALGAKLYDFPADFVNACTEALKGTGWQASV